MCSCTFQIPGYWSWWRSGNIRTNRDLALTQTELATVIKRSHLQSGRLNREIKPRKEHICSCRAHQPYPDPIFSLKSWLCKAWWSSCRLQLQAWDDGLLKKPLSPEMNQGISTPDKCRNYVQSFRRGAMLKSINTGYKPFKAKSLCIKGRLT